MDFQQTFLKVLKTNTAITKSVSLLDYLPKSMVIPSAIGDNLPYVQAYGSISCTYPYYYMLSDLDSYCLLYTENGSGTLTVNNHSFLLIPGTLAFINCKELHRLEISQSVWDYRVLFINGNPLSFLHHTIGEMGTVITLSLNSAVPDMLQKLFFQLDKNDQNAFFHSKFILDILFEVILENNRLSDVNTPIPNYLIQIKNVFDTDYQKNLSLDVLEQEYHISRYRICREFTRYFYISPIQYLNHKRIAIAKETLIQTDKRINEIGQMVGFENINHFIRLFKQQTGFTPLEFRKQQAALIIKQKNSD